MKRKFYYVEAFIHYPTADIRLIFGNNKSFNKPIARYLLNGFIDDYEGDFDNIINSNNIYAYKRKSCAEKLQRYLESSWDKMFSKDFHILTVKEIEFDDT
jgi:hypothetical protein